ncbi:MAG: PAS domain-containing protein [Planctomycetes bacterium]|nr:PAS domain-containing protein [Planctomycetota bacterium]
MEVSENFLQTAIDGIRAYINIVDKDYRIIFVNDAITKKLQKPRQSIVGKKCHEQLWKKDGPCENCVTPKVFETGQPQQILSWDTNVDGEKRCIEHFVFPIPNKQGHVEYAVEIFMDVTEKKLMEKEREEQRLELGKRIRELRHAYEELKSLQNQLLQAEKMASIGLLASSLAHELDTPLATISGYCELLMEDVHDEKALGKIKTISDQIAKCQNTVRNLLVFSRKSDSEKKEYNINTLITTILALVEHRLKINKINIHRTFDNQLPPLFIEGNQIQQVILNLVNNSVDALPNGGDLFIKTRKNIEEKSVEIVFEDTGTGIPEEYHSRIFEPFFTTKEQGKGTGLGLSICKDIISAHNGSIRLDRNSDKGARFIISLPCK